MFICEIHENLFKQPFWDNDISKRKCFLNQYAHYQYQYVFYANAFSHIYRWQENVLSLLLAKFGKKYPYNDVIQTALSNYFVKLIISFIIHEMTSFYCGMI